MSKDHALIAKNPGSPLREHQTFFTKILYHMIVITTVLFIKTRPIAISCVLQAFSDGPTDQPTDRPTNRMAYRVACTHLKN